MIYLLLAWTSCWITAKMSMIWDTKMIMWHHCNGKDAPKVAKKSVFLYLTTRDSADAFCMNFMGMWTDHVYLCFIWHLGAISGYLMSHIAVSNSVHGNCRIFMQSDWQYHAWYLGPMGEFFLNNELMSCIYNELEGSYVMECYSIYQVFARKIGAYVEFDK